MLAHSSHGALRRKLIVLGTLVAFVLQGLVVQTHLHFIANSGQGAIAANVTTTDAGANTASGRSDRQKSPNDAPARCQICQEFLHAGQYLTPAPVLAHAPALVIVALAVRPEIAVAIGALSHAWQGRAPPSA